MATSSKRAYAIPRSAAPRAFVPPQEMLKSSSVLVSVKSLGPGAYKVCLSLSCGGTGRQWSTTEMGALGVGMA